MAGTITAETVREGRLARLASVTCTLGRHDKPYPEVHERAAWTIALVQDGTFKYRGSSTNRPFALKPGWLLLGRPRAQFECSHDRDGGDCCASLTIPEGMLWEVAEAAGVAESRILDAPATLPPLARVSALLERARIRDVSDIDEIAYLVAESVVTHAQHRPLEDVAPHPSHVGRIQDAIDRIESSSEEELSLATLAESVGFSPFYFLRVFRRTTGTTPHQYLVGARLRRAAQMLLETKKTVTQVAFDVGFQDLSNFVRTFHRVVGCSPSEYRGPQPTS